MRPCTARPSACALLILLAAASSFACGDDDASTSRADAGRDSSAPTGRDSGPRDATVPIDSGVDADSGTSGDPVARGKYLVENVATCGECHTPRLPDGSFDASRKLAGVECFVDVDPGDDAVGCVSSRNLTDHETGLKNRRDEEIKDMFLKGERPDGKALHPLMPYWVLGNMSDEDADAIVAYLRTVPGVHHMLPPNQAPFTPPDQPAPLFPAAKIPMPRADYAHRAEAMRGRYLAGNVGLCMECHTPRDSMQNPIVDMAFQGGAVFRRGELRLPPNFPELIYSANVTPHATGIADWSLNEVMAAIQRGEDKDQGGAALCPPMPAGLMSAYAGLTDGDVRDIAHYLLSIPARDNAVPADCEALPPPDSDGGT